MTILNQLFLNNQSEHNVPENSETWMDKSVIALGQHDLYFWNNVASDMNYNKQKIEFRIIFYSSIKNNE